MLNHIDTTESKTIGNTSAFLLAGLQEHGKLFFDTHDAMMVLSNRTPIAIRSLLSEMTKRGLLMRLKDGLYHIIPYDRAAADYFPDWHLVAHHLAGKTPYYIGYYSALVLHDLTTQPSFQEQVVVAKPFRPNIRAVKGVPFQFIYHNPLHFFGITKKWIDGVDQVNCSDLEKTFLDCLFQPDYAGGIVEIAKAIFKSKSMIRENNLNTYLQLFGSDAVIRRLGFLLELLEILPNLSNNLLQLIPHNTSYVVLDTGLPKEGKSNARWGIIQNMDLETIKTSVFS